MLIVLLEYNSDVKQTINLSAIVLAKNEAKNIAKCLSSLTFCDEIVVIDDFSVDGTPKIAKKYTYRIFRRHLNNDFSAQRNFGLQKAKGEWVLYVDADEYVSPRLAKEIKEVIRPKNSYKVRPYIAGSDLGTTGYLIKRQDYFLGNTLKFGETGNIKLLRLAKRSAGKWKRPVHEVWDVLGERGKLHEPLLHHPHPTISAFLKEINRYTDIEAKYRIEQGHNKLRTLIELIIYPSAKFVLNYFIKLGILDGSSGLVMALIMSYHSMLVRVKILKDRY